MRSRTMRSRLHHAPAKTLLFAVMIALTPIAASAQIWTVLTFDFKGDGRDPALADAAQLSYRYDKAQDMLWFRITLYGQPPEDAFGVSIAVDTSPGDDAVKVNWWGTNKDFRFDKLVTAWVRKTQDGYQGDIGIADAAGVKARNLTNLVKNNLQIRVEGDSILIGMKRTDLTDRMKMNLIAAVGSNREWNDDIPNVGSAALDLAAPRPARGLRELDMRRNNLQFPSGYKTLADNQAPAIIRRGQGRHALILIPGVYSGAQVFDGFIERTQSQYKFYLVTPPGLNQTVPRPLPAETTSYGEFPWTRRLERDLLDLIHKEKLRKPVLVVHGFPGSLAAEEIASQHPEAVGGIIEIASMPAQLSPSPRDPRKPATPEERIELVNESWVQKWFKYVTPETWESNNYAAKMFTSDLERAERVRQQVEAAPLEVKIRYLAEFMASDHSAMLAHLEVPLLALRPGFNDQFLTEPSNSFYKTSFQTSWEAFAGNARIQLRTVPDARVLILDDQPKIADDAIASFVEKVAPHEMARDSRRVPLSLWLPSKD